MKNTILKLCLILAASATTVACTNAVPSEIRQTVTTAISQPDTASSLSNGLKFTEKQNSYETMPATAANTQSKPERMLIYNHKRYIDTGEVSTAGRCGVLDGKIKKTVSASQIPTKELQSNFGKGYGFQIGSRSNRIEVCIDDTWHIFAYNEDNFEGVSVKVKRSTAKSAVLMISNTSKKQVAWGDEFLLEKKDFKTGEWHAVPYQHTDFAFHCIAYFASPDSSAKWKTNWSYLYGTLKPGTYRIVKKFWDDHTDKQTEYYTLSAKFRIEKAVAMNSL